MFSDLAPDRHGPGREDQLQGVHRVHARQQFLTSKKTVQTLFVQLTQFTFKKLSRVFPGILFSYLQGWQKSSIIVQLFVLQV